MIVGVIGLKNQAAKIINYLMRLEYVKNIIIYHPNQVAWQEYNLGQEINKNISLTNNFLDILEAKAVFISSPSKTHAQYIKKILSSNAYTSTHGLSYKKSYAENWRFNDTNPFSSIFGNVGIHYIHLFESIFGEIKSFNLISYNVNKQVAFPDTANLNLVNSEGVSASIFLSYSAPFQKNSQCIFNDGILFDNNGVIEIQRPRDSFDDGGRFVAAKRTLLDVGRALCNKNSLERSIDYFFRIVSGNGQFNNDDFELALNASKRVLDMTESCK